jgi:hypothetical protein
VAALGLEMKTLCASVVSTLVLWSETLFAQAASLPVSVRAQLPPECQGVIDFGQRLLSRSERLRWANVGEPSVVFDVSVQQFPTGLIGQLQIRELTGRYTQRTVQGNTCDGVLDALAFVGAVLVEEPEPAPEPPPPVPEPPVPPPPPPPEVTQWEPPSPPTHIDWGLGVTGGATTATSSSLAQPNIGARASLAWKTRYWDPWIMLGFDGRFDATAHSKFTDASVDTVFGGWTLHANLSPIRWPAMGSAFLRPLATFEIGKLTASNANANNVNGRLPVSRTWVAAGLGVTGEVMLAAPIAAVADLGLQVPLRRSDYYYQVGDEQSHAYSVPYLGLVLRLGAIIKF